ncbi:MAG: hypothetical protein AAF734_00660 [Bacteroidota bacterium]
MEKYLLQDTSETRQMIEHLKTLLKSNEPANVEIAFQILAQGGIPRELYPLLTNTNEKIMMCYSYQFYQVLQK